MTCKIEFRTTAFELSHGKKPAGRGSWAFLVMGETVFAPGSLKLAEAKKWMRDHCRSTYKGFVTIEVAP